MSTHQLQSAVAAVLGEIILLRRDLHQHPELSGHESRTSSVVADRLERAGLRIRRDVGGHGVVAIVGSGSPCILLRADMDALPLRETTGLPFASVCDGVMHACGHDFHTAWLVGVGLVLQQLGLSRGSVMLVFQPAEEALGGAVGMIRDGVLDDPNPDAVCGAHVWPDLPVGVFGLRPGSNLAAADRFTIRLTGAGSHGANPHKGLDPIPVAAQIVLALQTLVSRRLDPLSSAVVTVGRIAAGSAFNIIPSTAELEGTVRTLLPEHQDFIERELSVLATHIAMANGCTAEVEYQRGVPPTIADEQMTAHARQSLQQALGPDSVRLQELPSMGAEDFSYFLQQRPGALLWVGTAPASGETKPLHHPGYIGDEGCLAPTITGLSQIALDFLAQR